MGSFASLAVYLPDLGTSDYFLFRSMQNSGSGEHASLQLKVDSFLASI